MAAAATPVKILAVLQLVAQALTGRVYEGTKGFSRIIVASPGIRKYTYNIAHDPEGRDFSIDFNPLDTEVDTEVRPFFEADRDQQGFQQFQREYTMEGGPGAAGAAAYNEIQLKVKTPSYKEQRTIDKEIKSVYSSLAKKPVKTNDHQDESNLEDFDLGLMGYGDFMDTPGDYESEVAPNPYPIQSTYSPVTHDTSSNLDLKKIKIPDIQIPQIKLPKFTLPKLSLKKEKKKKKKKEELPNVEVPQFEYGFTPVQPTPDFPTPLFTPALDENHLKGLGEKAFSKIFMAQSLAEPVPVVYPKASYSADPNFSKTLFVPVYLLPRTDQVNMDRSLHRFDPAAFESQRIR